MRICELIREGKSKRVYATDDPDLAVVYFKDEAIAYQGLKRGRIMGKGEVNNVICQKIFAYLQNHGVETAFVSGLDPRQSVFRRAQMLPVEVKVRNRVAGSLPQRIGLQLGSVLNPPVIEFLLKNAALDNPMINISHITAMKLATREEMEYITETALRVNQLLIEYMKEINVELIDFQLEFGRWHDKIMIADDISPDSARFWDAGTHEPMDFDRFRRDLGGAEQGYRELLSRILNISNDE